MQTTAKAAPASEAAIFGRVWEGEAMTPEIAGHVLKLRFSDADQARARELASRNREGQLSQAESEELDNYVRVGDLLAILQSKARTFLREPRAGNGNG